MARLTMITAKTAVSSSQDFNTDQHSRVAISADLLAGAETVNIYVDGKAVTDNAGTVQKLTATIPILSLQGGINYTVSKDATAGLCGVYMWTPGKQNV